MFLKSSRVTFHNKQTPVYFGGDTVAGTISFDLVKEKTFADLTFEAKGDTTCRWTVHRDKNSTTYRSFEIIFKIKYSLFHSGNHRENGNVTLQPGTHKFNFAFSLPPNAPTVITGVYGRVKYTMKITAVRKLRFDVPFKVPFYVIYRNDLNTNPRCARPLTMTLSKTFSTFFVNQGSMSVAVAVPFVGYVSGQSIQMQCNIKNPSEVKISAVIFSLKQQIIFICTSPRESSRCVRETIVKLIGVGADKGQEISYPVCIKIPALPPSSVGRCLITTEYFLKRFCMPDAKPVNTPADINVVLKENHTDNVISFPYREAVGSLLYLSSVKVVVNGLHKNSKALLPITIGTVPLYRAHGYNQNYTQKIPIGFSLPSTSKAQPLPCYNPPQPSAPPGNISSDDPPPYNELDPPTYEECRTSNKMMEAHSDDEDADVGHVPVYPVYHFPSHETLKQD